MAKTRFNIKMIVLYVAISFFFFSIGVFLLKDFNVDDILGVVFLFVTAIMILIFAVRKHFNYIYADHNRLILVKRSKKEIYWVKDIQKIHLNSIEGNGVMKVDFVTKESLFLDENIYVDLWKIKKILEKKIRTKDRKSKIFKNPSNRRVLGSVFNHFSLVVAFIVFFGLLLVIKSNSFQGQFIGVICLLCFCFTGLFFFYFSIEDNCLIVKNHMYFWYKKKYSLTKILNLSHEHYQSDVYAEKLVITTKEYKTIKYLAASYRRKDWRLFFKDLIR